MSMITIPPFTPPVQTLQLIIQAADLPLHKLQADRVEYRDKIFCYSCIYLCIFC